MNVNDSEKMAGKLISLGYEPAESLEDAELVIVNTCSVRQKPDNKAYSFIGEVGRIKKRKPNLILAVGGCIPQWHAKELSRRYPFLDAIFGTYNFFKIDEILKRTSLKKPYVEILNSKLPSEAEEVSRILPMLSNPYSAYVTIQRGCDRFCSYCIVPFVRGRERSVPKRLVLEEIKRLLDLGVKEITLLGQNIDFYGKGLEEKISLADLLYEIDKIEGIKRIRFVTSHPSGFSEEIVEAIKHLPKVCEFVHLPPQSGSDRILKRMNRGYTSSEYIEKVKMLKENVPGVALSGDFIVGFPGETEDDFEQTLKLVKECVFDQAFVFQYSPRPFTKASSFKDDVSPAQKNERLKTLTELVKRQAQAINSALVGRRLEVLVEGPSPKDPEKLVGRTRTNKVVVFEGQKSDVGKILNLKIKEATPYFLLGGKDA